MKQKVRNAYNFLAAEYHQNRKNATGESHFYNEQLEMPTTLKMLGNLRGKRVLDLGCGPGFYAKIMSARGAQVTGIDISEELISLARKEAPRAVLHVGDAEHLPYRAGEFDIVLSSLVLGHLKSWDAVLKEVRRVLKKNGLFVFSIYNPVTDSLVKKKRLFRTFRVIEHYFTEGWKRGLWVGEGKSAKIVHHHKTYGTVVRYLVRNGFEILDYEDSKPIAQARKMYPVLYKRFSSVPHFCTWKVRKR